MKKRIISAITSIVMGALSFSSVMSANAADSSDIKENRILFMGDSIVSTATEKVSPYFSTVSSYCGGTAVTIHTSGITSDELLDKIKNNSSYRSSIQGYKRVVVSVGGNDLIDAFMAVIAEKYPEQYDPENPYKSLLDIFSAVKEEEDADLELMAVISDMNTALMTEVKNCTATMKQIDEEIKKLNPEAEIVYQNLYNPMLMSKEDLDEYLKDRPSNYRTAYNTVRNLFKNNIKKFNNDALGALENVKIADVYSRFTEAETSDNYGYSNIYTDIMKSSQRDFHPNQLGNHVIASAVIEALDVKDGNKEAAANCYVNDYTKMPRSGHKTFCNAIGLKIGDKNGDNEINASDASLTLSVYATMSIGGTVTLKSTERIAADTDCNVTIDAFDASTILAHYASVSTGGSGVL